MEKALNQNQKSRVPDPALLSMGCVTLGKLLNLSEPLGSHWHSDVNYPFLACQILIKITSYKGYGKSFQL